MTDLEGIDGQRQLLEDEIIDLVMASFTSGFYLTHEAIMSQIDRLEPAGRLKLVKEHAPKSPMSGD